jgi:hypothetical protein
MADYDYIRMMNDEVKTIRAELEDEETRKKLEGLVERLGLPWDLALAAAYRTSRRSGVKMSILIDELVKQLDAAAVGSE